jgi:hypothetical protein
MGSKHRQSIFYQQTKERDIRVSGKVDEEEVNDKLNDLNPCDPFFPPDTNATRCLEVVPVHDDMHHQVKRDWDVTLNINGASEVKHTTEVCPIN